MPSSSSSSSSSPPSPTPQTPPLPPPRTPKTPETPICEYTTPCTTHRTMKTPPSSSSTSPSTTSSSSASTSIPPRKLISHIFGRNKVATKLVPPHVWPHYCRKHYQRARYRAPNWPAAQVDLVLTALERMEKWGGVGGFEVVLRKRAMGGDGDDDGDDDDEEEEEEDDDGEEGDDDGEGEGGKRTHARTRITGARIRDRDNGKGKGKGKAKMMHPLAARTGKAKRKSPSHPQAPVPDWMKEHLGRDKTFEEVRVMLAKLKVHLQEEEKLERSVYGKKKLRFPDIEILPTFEEWVYEADRKAACLE